MKLSIFRKGKGKEEKLEVRMNINDFRRVMEMFSVSEYFYTTRFSYACYLYPLTICSDGIQAL